MHTIRNPAHENQSPGIRSPGWEPLVDSSVSPQEFFDFRVSLATVRPETALMYAVLEDAFLCLWEHSTTSATEQAREANDWFFTHTSDGLFSFVSICAALGLGPELIRRRLRDWRQPRLKSTWEKT